MKAQLIPARETRADIRVVNSRFIATVAPVFSVDAARKFIERINEEFSDATHNVPAYVIGHGASTIAHCSDDGEPSGTAGPPVLAVLRGSGLGDAAVVVTRYFGGTKLGTGGLVRAYSDAVREVLSILPRAVKMPTHTVLIKTPYPLFEPLRRLIEAHQGQIIDEAFTHEVTISARFPQLRFSRFQSALQQLSRGQVEAQVTGSNESTIVPLAPDSIR